MEASETNKRVAEALGWIDIKEIFDFVTGTSILMGQRPTGVEYVERQKGPAKGYGLRGEIMVDGELWSTNEFVPMQVPSYATNPHHALDALIEYTCSRFGVTQVYFTEGDFWYVGISQPDYEIAEGQGSYCAAICAAILAAAGGGE